MYHIVTKAWTKLFEVENIICAIYLIMNHEKHRITNGLMKEGRYISTIKETENPKGSTVSIDDND